MARRKNGIHKYEAVQATGFEDEPTWENASDYSKEELIKKIKEAFNYYTYVHTTKDCKDFLVAYVAKINKKNSVAVKAAEEHIVRTYGTLARMVDKGLTLPSEMQAKLDAKIQEVIDNGNEILRKNKTATAKKPPKRVVSIQERIREQVSFLLGEIEGEVDNFLENKCQSNFNFQNWLKAKEVKGMLASRIAGFYSSVIVELKEVVSGKDDDLNEAYSFLTKPQKKRYLKFIQSLIDDATEWSQQSKKNRKRRKRKTKPVSERIVNVKYKKECDTYNLTSESPESMIGASQVWIFDTKNRFLYKYVSDYGFDVKGTTLKEWDKDKSFKKKIRKPEVILSDIKSAGKVKLRKLMDEVRAKETKVTGRMNDDMVIVRVIK